MAHHGWIFPVVVQVAGYLGTFLCGILTGIYGHVFKYSFDQATKLKELIIEIRRFVSAYSPGWWTKSEGQDPRTYSSSLKTKLELIRCYALIRRLVPLPPKQNVYQVADKLPNFLDTQYQLNNLQKAENLAKEILALLA